MNSFDIVIIGGGPAGTAAALTLQQRDDLSVLVLEKGDYTQTKIGESLSPGVSGLLKYLKVDQLFRDQQPLDQWGNCAAWGSDHMVTMDFMATVHGAGWSLDRSAFEKMLAECVEKGPVTRRSVSNMTGGLRRNARVTRLDWQDPFWLITLETPSKNTEILKARYIIDAGGRGSRWALQGSITRQRYDNLVAIACWLPQKTGKEIPTLTHVEATADGWWYAAPVPEGKVVVAFMTDSDIAHKKKLKNRSCWLEMLDQTHHIKELVSLGLDQGNGQKAIADPAIIPAHSSLVLSSNPSVSARTPGCSGSSRVFPAIPVGDAAVSHDPLSASGIPTALGTGIQAARVAASYLSGRDDLKSQYMESLQIDFRRYLATQWKIYQLETRFCDQDFWRFRHSSLSLNPEKIITISDLIKEKSIFAPGPVVHHLRDNARKSLPAHHLVRDTQLLFPDIPAERIALALQDLQQPSL